MKILQVNCVYKKGSTGKIVYDLHKGLLAQGIESVVCYGRGEPCSDAYVYKTCPEWYSKLNNLLSRLTGVMYGGCFFSTNRLVSIIKKERPDVVHLHCINGYFVNIYRLINWLKKNNIKTVLTLHAEFMYTGGCGHALDCEQWRRETGCRACPQWRKETKSWFFDRTPHMWKRMKAAFSDFDNNLLVTSVSPWLEQRAAESPVFRNKPHCTVMNGLDTEIFRPSDEGTGQKLRSELEIRDEKIVFHATAGFSAEPEHFKGGHFVLELARQMPEVKFVVVGTVSGQVSAPENVLILGRVADQNRLAAMYSLADVTLLTSKRETFSMVTAESLCCGTPVVGFFAGGPEQIAIPEYSDFVEYGDVPALKAAVEAWLRQGVEERKIAEQVGRYSKTTMLDAYLHAYESLM